MVGEPSPQCGDVSHPVGIAQCQPVDLVERGRAGIAGQICDVGTREPQDGLTPVIMTL